VGVFYGRQTDTQRRARHRFKRRNMSDPDPRRKRIRHIDGDGCARSLTFSCLQRRPFFGRDAPRTWFFQALKLARQKHPIDIWAYVIMPEHVHVLIWPKSHTLKISQVLSTVKQSVAKRARNYLLKHNPAIIERLDGDFHFWQDGPGYDRNIESDAVVWQTIEYIHLNPVRRGLCQRPEEWPWSSAGFYAGIAEGPISIDRQTVPSDPRR
jgi:putative transposase